MKPRKEEAVTRQRLSLKEEQIVERHIRQLEVWGWPLMVSQLQKMATELLRAKGDIDNIRPN